MCTKPHDREDEKGTFGINVFKIYFYTFYSILKSHRAFEDSFNLTTKFFHNVIYLFCFYTLSLTCSHTQKKTTTWGKMKQSTCQYSLYLHIFPCLSNPCIFQVSLPNFELIWKHFCIFRHSVLSCYLVSGSPLAFVALLMYLIVYKIKHFVLYIVNLLHSIS